MICLTSWHSYPKIYNFGHKAIKNLFAEEVQVEEKIDGSFYSFGMFDSALKIRSKGKEMAVDAPEKLFIPAVETTKKLQYELTPGWTYRAEFLAKPKHNVLAYDRIPKDHLIIFDINPFEEEYLSYEAKKIEADRLGLECAPLLYKGKINSLEEFQQFLELDSILGGVKIEGVVIKNYKRFGSDGKVLMGKYVSTKFKERHKKEWKMGNPQGKDILTMLQETFRTEARWHKGIQHLRENGELIGDMRDIGPLIKEIQRDTKEECEDEIKEALWKWAWPHICRKVTAGFPEWYKQKLLGKQFGETEISK